MSTIDNIFMKVITDEEIVREYNISRPEQYLYIAQRLRSVNAYVVAIATALKNLDTIIEQEKSDMRLRHKSDSIIIKDADMKSVYKKIVTLFEKAR